MSESDKLWREAMEEAAKFLRGLKLGFVAYRVRNLPRPAGWGEGGEDE